MTGKEKYVKSIDNLKPDEYLKQKVMKNIETKPKKSIYLRLANATLIFILAISCTFVMQEKVGDKTLYMLQDIENMANAKIKRAQSIEQLQEFVGKIDNNSGSYFESYNGEVDFLSVSTDALVKELKTSHSETNVQVQGIDEADIVKTDGKYIYYSGVDNKIIIVEANEQLTKVAEITINENQEKLYGGIQELYLNNNKLVAIWQMTSYSCGITDLIGYGTGKAVINIYNIEDKSNITKERRIELQGNYTSSRMIGEEIYIVTNHYIKNNEELLPVYTDSLIGEEVKKVNLHDVYYIEGEESKQFLNISGLNINKNEEIKTQSFLGMGQEIYVNEDNMYVTSTKYEKEEVINNDNTRMLRVNFASPKTQIYKFKLFDGNVSFREYAEVEGRIINQFALDETDGYFRIATTSTIEGTPVNNLFILNARLEKTGEITGIAKGENIYAVRFIKDKAYMVTYEQVDPLFVIDLSDASNPQILGELKIPGFSNYLHPYDENHLIGIGKETQVQKNGNVKTIGLKISLFDISNSAEPKEVSTFVIEGEYAHSTALYNHKAVLFIKEKNTLVIPVTIGSRSKKAVYAAEVLKITPEEGIKELGRIVTDAKGEDWTKQVDRIVRINDNIYSVCRSGIIANNIETLQETGRVDF